MFLKRKQQGSMLMIAIFIIVVLGVVAAALLRVVSNSSNAVVYEVLGQRAFLAAQSGLQQGAANLFPIGSVANTACFTNFTTNYTVSGLENCSVQVVCNCRVIGNTGTETCATNSSMERVFDITATGSCGTKAPFQASRRLRIEARSVQ